MRLIGLPGAWRVLACSSLPDLPATARLRFECVALIERLASNGLAVTRACRLVGVPRATYYRWRKRVRAHGAMGLCDGRAGNRRRRSAPVRDAVRERIRELRKGNPVGKEKLTILLAREGVSVGSSSVQRVLNDLFERGVLQRLGYAQRLTLRRRQAAKRAHALRKTSSVKPRAPGELVQVDTLHERSHAGRVRYQLSAQDPTSKWLHAQMYRSATSSNAGRFLEELITSVPFKLVSVQVDNGSEYMGHFERECQERDIAQYLIPPASPKCNGMIERTQRVFREEHYAFEPPTLTFEDERAALAAFVHYYNHQRPHQALGYLTPAEYLKRRNLQDLSQMS